MNFLRAIPIHSNTRLAFYGDQGTIPAIISLARQFERPSLLMTSIPLDPSQLALADQHYTIQGIADLSLLQEQLPAGITLLAIPPTSDSERQQEASSKLIPAVRKLADHHQVPLLLEVAAQSAAVTDHIDTILQVAGTSLIEVIKNERSGKMASPPSAISANKHRPNHILLYCQESALVNTIEAHTLYCQVKNSYDSLILADLSASPEHQVIAAYRRLAAVILAGGGSQRLGQPKQLLDWFGQPFVRAVAQTAIDACCDPVIVVTGHQGQQVQHALDGLPVQITQNSDWQAGQSTSVKTGLAAVPQKNGAALFMMVDQPQIPLSLLQALQQMHASDLPHIVAPMVEGQRANPVLFDRSTFADLAQISGDSGGRQLFSKYPIQWLPWPDNTILLDVDTLEDYQQLIAACR